MDELDLDSFIANIEETAPEEPVSGKLVCDQCGGKLEEEEDGNLTCPICCVQATNILQYDETELHHDEQGRPVYGQRVALADHRAKHQSDYGWAWSTDEAIAHILSLQLDALEKANLVPDLFRAGITNMWLKYWLETLAPHIKEEYTENEMIQISSRNALKLRDIEVLFKVKDKIMVPLRALKGSQSFNRVYHMMDSNYTRASPELLMEGDDDELGLERSVEQLLEIEDDRSSGSSSVSFEFGPMDRAPEQLVHRFNQLMTEEPAACNSMMETDPINDPEATDDGQELVGVDGVKGLTTTSVPGDDMEELAKFFSGNTKNLSKDSINLLTLNRTLAFIEATSRCLPQEDPLFAADIIRACNQHLIPFYGSFKFLPEHMKLNSRDRLMFQKTTPPTPIQLTRTASLLINNIYKDQLPKSLPIPDLNSILKRFIRDMNLPDQLYGIIRDKVSFHHFQSTRPKTFVSTINKRLPQYDRWAFGVLVYHLKVLFNLGNNYLDIQEQSAREALQASPSEKFFIMNDWIGQASARLDLIIRHDPYILYHPLAQVDKMEISSQLASYVERQIDARVNVDIRSRRTEMYYDANFRNELVDILKREIRPPSRVKRAMPSDEVPESTNIRYPLTDAMERTRPIWSDKVDRTHLRDLIYNDFTKCQMLTLTNLPRWCIYDNQVSMNSKTLYISHKWPQAFKTLLDIGAFLCFCRPVELVNQVRMVEEALQPQTRVIRRTSRASQPMERPGRSYVRSTS